MKSVPGGNAFADDRDDDSGSGAVTPVIEYTVSRLPKAKSIR